jgi:quercetin dioxygenase-like cupin family protein
MSGGYQLLIMTRVPPLASLATWFLILVSTKGDTKMTHELRRCLAAAAVGATGALLATGAYAATSTPIGSGTMDFSELIGGPATLSMRTFEINPGEVLGWHYHPGSGAYTIVVNGVLTIEDGCGGEAVYTQGQAFLEHPNRVHRGKNLTGEPVLTAQTFIVPLGTGTSVPTNQQLCGAPLNVHECKGDSWKRFNHPRSFMSFGDCLRYVITSKWPKDWPGVRHD